jgi:outer membrane protein
LGLPANTKTEIDNHLPATIRYTDANRSILQRADIRLSNQLIQQKELELKGITAENKPQVSTYFRFNYQSQFNKTSDIKNNDFWYKTSTVGISTTIPLFDGYRRKNRMNAAKTELQQLRFRQEQSKQLAQTEQVRAWETFNNDNKQYQITKQNLELAEKVFTTRKALYAEGVSSLIELLDAEKELSNSRNLYIQAMINVQTSLVNIHKANGTLLTEFITTL